MSNLPLGDCGSGNPGKAEKYNSLECRKAAELASSCSQRSQRDWRNPKVILESREMKARERKAWIKSVDLTVQTEKIRGKNKPQAVHLNP